MTERKLIEGWKEKPSNVIWIKHSGGCDGDSNHCCLINDMQTFIDSLLQQQAELSFREGVEDIVELMEAHLEALELGYGRKSDIWKSGYLTLQVAKDKLNSLTQEP